MSPKCRISWPLRPLLCAVLAVALCQVALAASEDYYKLLGVARSATADQIKRAFKKLVLEKHPDRNKADPNANALFMRINRAYEILKSPEMRQKYDRFGEEGIKAHEEEGQQHERHAGGAKGGGIFADDPQIVKLTPERYESIAKDAEQIWFVNFYASHVKRSEKFADLWREVGHELEDVIRVAAVDCRESGYLCESIPELRDAEPPVFFFYPGRIMYTGPLTKEAMTDAALKRFSSEHADLTSAGLSRSLGKAGALPHWLIAFCGRGLDCFSDRTLKKLAAVFHDFVGIGRVDCGAEQALCQRLNPTADGATAVGARLFVNATAWATGNDLATPKGLPVTSLHTQETARAVLRLLPPLADFAVDAVDLLSRAVFEGASLRSAHLLLLTAAGDHAGDDSAAQLKRLQPLLRPHKIRVGRLACSSRGESSGEVAQVQARLCQRLGLDGVKLPAAVLVKKTGAVEVYYGQMHYMDVKEFALTAAANPMTALNSETFEALVEKSQKDTIWFVDFFAPWCPPCMKALPEFREAARLHQSELAPRLPAGLKLRFASVDCTIERAVCARYDIESYPSLLLLMADGRRVKFRGSKFAHQMLAFVEAFVLPAATFLKPDTFEQTVLRPPGGRTHAWMVYFHSFKCQPCVEFMPELNALAKNFRDHAYIRVGAVDCVTHRSLCQSQGVRSYPTIRAYPVDKTGPDDHVDFKSPFRDGDSVSSWLEGFAPQPIMRFNRHNFQTELAGSEPWVVYFYADWCGPCRAFAPTFRSVAEELKLHANFGKVDCDAFQDLCVSKGINNMPSVALFRHGKMLTHLTGQSTHTLESAVRSQFAEKRPAARLFYGYHASGAGSRNIIMGGDGDGWQRIVIDSGDGGGFFNMGDGMQFNFQHDEF